MPLPTMEPVADWAAVGQRVSVARNALGWTQEEMAERAGVALEVVTGIEDGTRNATSIEWLVIGEACDLPLHWFLYEMSGLHVTKCVMED